MMASQIVAIAISFIYLVILIKVVHAVGWRIPDQNERIIGELERLNLKIDSQRLRPSQLAQAKRAAAHEDEPQL